MYDATVSHAFSIFLIAPESCCFAVTSSSITSCCETPCNSAGSSTVGSCSSTLSSMSLLSTSSLLILAKDAISFDYMLHRVLTVSGSSMPYSTTLSGQSFGQAEVKVPLVTRSYAVLMILRQETMWK
ncbi:hypothetical protein AVEN_110936-1 [Araneus ventricosus]|uniref:Uncharacterized protein n=1 Tax=Araneus ventricosus TaxID=182803 RepID=A0A4Y2HD97_ARAVE|nr:hypothetical protein AVEN_110936-1 [Araneus ventricosus]